jgi:hypothetical protein
MDPSLVRIVDFLDREQIRATYTAVGEAAEVPVRSVGRLLGDRCPLASWVVAVNGHPSGYSEHEKHPALYEREEIITSGDELVRRMKRATVRPSEGVRPPQLVDWSERAAFEAAHPALMEELPTLVSLLDLVTAIEPKGQNAADMLVAGFSKLSVEEFREVYVLCAHGYAIGASILIRSMYERAVTAHHVHTHPDDAIDLIDYSAVQSGKHSRRVLEDFGEFYGPDRIAVLQESIAAKKEAEGRFQVPNCKACNEAGTCDHTHTNHTWGWDVVSMAKASKPLAAILVFGYSDPLLRAHATFSSLTAKMKRSERGDWRFRAGPEREKAAMVLMHAHLIVLAMVTLLRDHFALGRLSGPLRAAKEAFNRTWAALGYPEEALGLETESFDAPAPDKRDS